MKFNSAEKRKPYTVIHALSLGLLTVTAITVLACQTGSSDDALAGGHASPNSSTAVNATATTVATPNPPEHGSTLNNVDPLPVARESMMVIANFCLPFDPAIDAAAAGRELHRLPLVTEIHAGLTRVTSGPQAQIETDLAESFAVDENEVSLQVAQGLEIQRR